MTEMSMDLGGVVVATTLAFKEDASAPAGLAVDYDKFGEHVDFLMSNGCRGVGPNGSLGEYSSLTDDERRQVIKVAVEAVDGRGIVVAGAHGVGSHQARQWAEYAREDGADGVLLLPPIVYKANEGEVIAHYEEVAKAGLPIMAYNNPYDTKVDLVPSLVAKLAQIPEVVAIKEFSGDVRRVYEIKELCDIDIIAGADDVLFELMVNGAVGWFAGYPNAFPREAVELYNLCAEGKWHEAKALYEQLVTVFRWDSKTEFVQAIKLSMDICGNSYGGVTRPPRRPLSDEQRAQVTADTERALAALSARRAAVA